ncbi:hypothetical protein M5689_007638 [Euphorbia peplus]|nr:hypothetical protein M5689_007638 [Euphorbia peplus]
MPLPITDPNHVLWKFSVKNPAGGFEFNCKYCSKQYNDFKSKRCFVSHIKHLAKLESDDADNCPLVSQDVQKGMQFTFEHHIKPNIEILLKNDALRLKIRKVHAASTSRTMSKLNSYYALVDAGLLKDALKLNYDTDNLNMETNKFWEYAVKTPTGFMCKFCSKEYSEFNRPSVLTHIEHLAKLECEDEDVQNLLQQVSELDLNLEGMNDDNIDDDARLNMRNRQAERELKLKAKFDIHVAVLRSLHRPIP